MQVPPKPPAPHVSPVLHMRIAQQGSPEAPHAVHVAPPIPKLHTKPVLHMPPVTPAPQQA